MANEVQKPKVSLEEYDEQLAFQEGKCLICGTDTPGGRGLFHADHDHKTGKLRGLLCMACNLMLGHSKESTTTLAYAIAYLDSGGNWYKAE